MHGRLSVVCRNVRTYFPFVNSDTTRMIDVWWWWWSTFSSSLQLSQES